MSGLIGIMIIANFNYENIARRLVWYEASEMMTVAPVLKAATLGRLPTVQSLLAEGADANTRHGGWYEISALDAAALMGHLEIIRVLLDHGVDVNDADSSGTTVLHKAAYHHGRADVIDLLLSAGAYVNAQERNGSTPLHSAVKFGHIVATRALLAAGADATLRANDNLMQAPLDVAAEYGQVEVVRELVRHGVNVDASTGPFHLTALHHAVLADQTGSVEALLEAGANVALQMFQDETPLHFASERQFLETALALLRHGAPTQGLQGDGVDRCREPPLHAAARMGGTRGAAQSLELLLRWGADESELNSDGKNATEVIGAGISVHLQPEWRLPADADLVRELLSKAPAERAWRRRRQLVLCLARNRTTRRRNTEVSGQGEGGVALARGGGGGGGGGGGPENGGDLDAVMASLLEFDEEGFFRTIVGYL